VISAATFWTRVSGNRVGSKSRHREISLFWASCKGALLALHV
jgi:hypothetical protein